MKVIATSKIIVYFRTASSEYSATKLYNIVLLGQNFHTVELNNLLSITLEQILLLKHVEGLGAH